MEPSALSLRAKYVLDGGALLHKVKWARKGTYQGTVKQHVSYVRAKYVLDGGALLHKLNGQGKERTKVQ